MPPYARILLVAALALVVIATLLWTFTCSGWWLLAAVLPSVALAMLGAMRDADAEPRPPPPHGS